MLIVTIIFIEEYKIDSTADDYRDKNENNYYVRLIIRILCSHGAPLLLIYLL